MLYIYIYIYEAPIKARNANIVYIYIYIYGPRFGNAESCLFLFAAQCFNTVSIKSGFLVSQLCVNTLPAT